MAEGRKPRWAEADHAVDPANLERCVCGQDASGDQACPELMRALERGEGHTAKARPWFPIPYAVIAREERPTDE